MKRLRSDADATGNWQGHTVCKRLASRTGSGRGACELQVGEPGFGHQIVTMETRPIKQRQVHVQKPGMQHTNVEA